MTPIASWRMSLLTEVGVGRIQKRYAARRGFSASSLAAGRIQVLSFSDELGRVAYSGLANRDARKRLDVVIKRREFGPGASYYWSLSTPLGEPFGCPRKRPRMLGPQ